MGNKFIIGVDGGNTKTHYALFDTEGNLVNFLHRGTASHECFPDGYEGARAELGQAVHELLKPAGLSPGDLSCGIFGLAGVDLPKQREKLTQIVAAIGLPKFMVCNDAFLGIKAGSEKGCGICSINGTGTTCAGIDPRGNWLQIGGTGFFFGDEAGGGFLSGMIVRKVYDSIYRCGPKTLLKDMLFKTLGIHADEQLVAAIYEYPRMDAAISAGVLFQAAGLGDEVAIELLRHTGRQTALSVVGAFNKLNFTGESEIDIIMAGSVYTKGENPTLADTFTAEVRKLIPVPVRFILLDVPPVAGAVIWALEELNGGLHLELRRKISNNLKQFEHLSKECAQRSIPGDIESNQNN